MRQPSYFHHDLPIAFSVTICYSFVVAIYFPHYCHNLYFSSICSWFSAIVLHRWMFSDGGNVVRVIYCWFATMGYSVAIAWLLFLTLLLSQFFHCSSNLFFPSSLLSPKKDICRRFSVIVSYRWMLWLVKMGCDSHPFFSACVCCFEGTILKGGWYGNDWGNRMQKKLKCNVRSAT